jgi:hypothetical protein
MWTKGLVWHQTAESSAEASHFKAFTFSRRMILLRAAYTAPGFLASGLAGRLELAPADFSLNSVLGPALRALSVRAHKKGLELVQAILDAVGCATTLDEVRARLG